VVGSGINPAAGLPGISKGFRDGFALSVDALGISIDFLGMSIVFWFGLASITDFLGIVIGFGRDMLSPTGFLGNGSFVAFSG